ncbi:hypothetical protein SG34_015035 [Thalassomonas viridans]|uniref:Uncharacterized protein n=1 Tax=Thalassomonas viridans TaxID=137584 RepID=A0AAF0C742_9GAMM|nr:hypothetical protein [Thalassomonas viridans]WDE02760.1 hypothetical protein SG34_015035 [Thalassomonas viridans]
MSKSLFEKLTLAGQPLSLKQSVTNNIGRILESGGYIDAALDLRSDSGHMLTDSIYPHAMAAIVDQSAGNKEQQELYQAKLEQTLLRHEPRLKAVTVYSLVSLGMNTVCRLKLELADEVFEQEFTFANIE